MGILNDFDSGIPIIQSWLKTQLHLPQTVDHSIIKRFIYACGGDLERTKKLIDLNFTMRTQHSHIFLERDPCSEKAEKILQTTDMLILPSVNPLDGSKVLFYRLADPDQLNFDFNEAIRMFFMFADLRFLIPDPNGITSGEIPIFDMAGFTLRHLAKVVLSTLRIYMKFTQEAHPVRLKEIHVINCPSYLDKVLMVLKPFIRNDVFKLMKFHLPGSDTLYKHVPKSMLPEEYGGEAGKINDIKMKWVNLLKENRHYLIDLTNWKVVESQRYISKKSNQDKELASTSLLSGTNSFSGLCID